MMQENFFVVPFRNPTLDDSIHYMTFHPPENKIKLFLKHYLVGHKNVQIDLEQKFAAFPTQAQAVAECERLGNVANDVDPDRIDARTLPNPQLAVEPGKL